MFTLPMSVKTAPRADVAATALASKSAYDPPDAGDDAAHQALLSEYQDTESGFTQSLGVVDDICGQIKVAASSSALARGAENDRMSIGELTSLMDALTAAVDQHNAFVDRFWELRRLLGLD